MHFFFEAASRGGAHSSLITAIFGLLGTVVGGLISFGVAWWAERNKVRREQDEQRREYQALAIAIAAEVETSMRMFRFRNARGIVAQLLQMAQAGTPTVFHMRIGENNLAITRSSLGKIGHLAGDIPPPVAEFVTLANSLITDLQSIESLQAWNGTLQALEGFYLQMLAIIDRAMDVGQQLVDEVAKQYSGYVPAPWNRPNTPAAMEVVPNGRP